MQEQEIQFTDKKHAFTLILLLFIFCIVFLNRMQQRKTTIQIHLICIIAFLSIPFLTAPEGMFSARVFGSPAFMKDALAYVFCVLFFYLNFYLLIDKYLFPKKYFTYAILTLACLLLIEILPNAVFHSQMQMPQRMPPPPEFHHHFPYFINFEHNVLKFFFAFFLSLTLKNNIRYQQIILEKTETELSFLKAQINPHFFFNSLNTIYSFSMEKSDKTPKAILQLADMMRYVIYEADKKFVPIQKEITYLENYIELQKSRLEETAQIDFSIQGNILQQQIAPLILMPFVENAIKYGIDTNTNQNKIRIVIMTDESKLVFIVQNKITDINGNTEENEKGIGLENTINRLNLLYPSNYNLLIKNNEKIYVVELRMNLI